MQSLQAAGVATDLRFHREKAANPRGRRLVGSVDRACLFFDLVHAIGGFGLRGLDLEAVLLGGGREEASRAMG